MDWGSDISKESLRSILPGLQKEQPHLKRIFNGATLQHDELHIHNFGPEVAIRAA